MDHIKCQRFMEDTLGIGFPALERVPPHERLEVLTKIVKALHNEVPFHNLGLWSISQDNTIARIPTYEESIHLGLSRTGGLCWTQNVFTTELLRDVGFNARLGKASAKNPGDHAVVIVQGVLKDKDVYVVETGFGTATFRAVSLDIPPGGTSDIYQDSTQTYRYTKNGDTYTRQHKVKQGLNPRSKVTDGWYDAYTFRLDVVDPDTLRDDINKGSYSDPESIFNKELRVVVWQNYKAVGIKNNTLLLEDDNGDWQESILHSIQDITKAIHKYFPMIPKEMVTKGTENWFHYFEASKP